MTGAAMDWHDAWTTGHTPWDLRAPSPPLERLLASGALTRFDVRDGARVAVPGCGRGHDLRVWSGRGFEVTGFELVPTAADEARALLALNRARATVLCRDVFGLLPEFAAAFDLVYDYTCYCALPRHLRAAYGAVLAGLLRAGGVLLHLTFPMRAEVAGPEGRPPFLITDADLHASFGPHFDLLAELPAEGSVGRREGAERWYVWRRAGGGA